MDTTPATAASADLPEEDELAYEDVGSVLEVTKNGRAKVTENNTGHG